MRLAVLVERLTTDVASIWYRALYPAASLAERGWRVDVFDAAHGEAQLKRYDALMIVKVLNARALALALEAHRLGVPVFLDLCDDIFVPEYGSGKGREATYFKATAQVASAVLTTGPVMAELLRSELGEAVPIVIVEDPAETAEQNRIVLRHFRRWRREAAVREMVGAIARPIRRESLRSSRTGKLIARARAVLLHKARRARNIAFHLARLQRKHLLRSLALGLHKVRRGRNIALHVAAQGRRRVLRGSAIAVHKARRGRNIALHLAAQARRRALRAGAVALHKVRRARNVSLHVARGAYRRLAGAACHLRRRMPLRHDGRSHIGSDS